MDCPSEEQMIRMKLESYAQVKYLDFDIPNRKLEVYHVDGIEDIQTSIAGLNLGDSLEGTEEAEPPVIEDQSKQKTIL
ncbi:MAG: cation transporter, partial [Mesonia sp.]|nr:cation transporter [Mesonia sp.]